MKEYFENYGIKLNERQVEQFRLYYSMLVLTNKFVNLTAITKEPEVWVKHFLDSVLPMNEIPQGARVLDVGSGAGFPGVPLAILRPDIDLTLIDSVEKRTNFLQGLVARIGVRAEIIHTRAEDYAHTTARESFDVVTARAVSALSSLDEYVLPFVKDNGIFLAYKGSNAEEEYKVAKKGITIMGGKLEKTLNFTLPDDMGERKVLVIRKVKPTPKKFPRDKNLPRIRPVLK